MNVQFSGAIGQGLRVLGLSFALAACGAGGSNETAATTSVVVPSSIAAPAGAVVLTLKGDISVHNAGRALDLDLATIEGLGSRSVTVYEPFEKREIEFEAVDLAAVLEAAGVAPGAESLHMTALDDYQVDLSIDDIRDGGVYLATRIAGEAIGVDQGGPIRIVFEDGIAAGKNPDQWIWSLRHIEVR